MAVPVLALGWLVWTQLAAAQPGWTESPGPSSPAAKQAAPAGLQPPGTREPPTQPGAMSAPALESPRSAEGTPGRRWQAPEALARLLWLRGQPTLPGRPISLVEALASARGRTQQLQVIHAYWRLAEAIGQHRILLEQSESLREFAARAEDAALLRAGRAQGLAALRAAALAALEAQQDLASAASISPNLPPPLPADLPHVGPYRTGFQEHYAALGVPSRLRLTDRVLPLRREAIEARATACQAAEDALEGVKDLYASGQMDFSSYLACLAERGQQYRALLSQACQYNHEIAEYALTVVSSPLSAEAVVQMLIKSQGGASGGGLPGSGQEGPTLAPPRPSGARGLEGRSEPPPVNERVADGAPSGAGSPLASGASRLGPPQQGTGGLQADARAGTPLSPALYPTLVGASPAVRVQHLGQALHGERTPPEAGQPITLGECLGRIPASLRYPVLDAYWVAKGRAAECQVLATQTQMLEQLVPLVLERGSRPGGAAAGLRLRAARVAAEADLREARIRLVEAQFELTRLVGRPLDGAWLIPTTPPHAGPYRLELESLSRELAQSRPVQRLAAAIPDLVEGLKRQAALVLEADSARAAITAAYQAGTRSLDELLPCIQCQTRETLCFLDTLTAYNRAIAQYVLAVLPSTITTDSLLATLVTSK